MQVLQNQSGHTSDVGSGHGGTAHDAVLTIGIGGVDVTTVGGDIGHQTQVRSNTPGGEVTHGTGHSVVSNDNIVVTNHQRTNTICTGQLDELQTVSLGNGDIGDHASILHIEQSVVHIVVNDDTDSTGIGSVNLLVGESQFTTLD